MRPDYVPPLWTRGPINRRYWASPRRVLAWLVGAPLVNAGVAVALLLAGETVLGVVLAVAAVANAVQAVVYAPRAWRASQHDDANT